MTVGSGRGLVLCPRPGGARHASVTYFHSPGAASAAGRGLRSPWRARCEGLQEVVAHGREGHRRIRGRFSLRFRGSARIVKTRRCAPMCTDPLHAHGSTSPRLDGRYETAETCGKTVLVPSGRLAPMCKPPRVPSGGRGALLAGRRKTCGVSRTEAVTGWASPPAAADRRSGLRAGAGRFAGGRPH